MLYLYGNGTIITMTKEKYTQAVVTRDGKIIDVGELEELKDKYKEATFIDLQGNTMLPAFIDAHSHLSSYAASFLQVNLEEAISLLDIKDRIYRFIKENDIMPGQWINGKGYDNNLLEGAGHPSIDFLDEVCPNNPIVISHASGHMGVFNTAALKELNITADNGYLEENDFFEALKAVPMADMKALMAGYEKALKKYASYGITTIQEGMMVSQMVDLYRYMLGNNMLWLDVVGYVDIQSANKLIDAFPDSYKKYHNNFKIGGYKIFLDGSPQGKTAWLRQPYEGEENYCGYPTMKDEEVLKDIELSVGNNTQLICHCNGDAACNQYISAISKVASENNDNRFVLIHGQLLGIDQLEAVDKYNIIPSFFVAHVYYWGDTHIKNLGMNRASNISPCGFALKEGILFTFHQDTPVIEPDMLHTVWCAVNRITKEGILLGDNQKIDVYEALKAVTINSAYQYFEEATKGSIEIGKNADFVILDQNPLEVDKLLIKDIKVLKTIKSDKIIFEK